MKIQNNTNSPAFGMKLKVNTSCAFYNGMPMISKAELTTLVARAEKIAGKEDVVDLFLGSITRLSSKSKDDFRESYLLLGKSIIKGKEALVNLNKSWLKSEEASNKTMPFESISKYLDTLESNLKIRKSK